MFSVYVLTVDRKSGSSAARNTRVANANQV